MPIKELYAGLFDGPHATPKPADAGPVFLGIKNVTDDGRLDLSDIRHIAEDDYANWTRRVEPVPGDIVFTYEATLNRYAIIPEGFRGCLGRRMALIRPDPAKMDTRFLHFYFFTDAWRQVISTNTLSGATVDRIPLTNFPDFPVNVPPLPIQRRIATILSAYDDLIENNLRRIKILEEMASALYREWFVEFKAPGVAAAKEDSVLGPIPRGWAVKTLGAACTAILDGDWIETKDQGGGDFRLLQISNVGVGEFVETGNLRFVSKGTFARLRCTEVVPGDILIARMPRPIGRAWLVHRLPWRIITAVDVAILRANPEVLDQDFCINMLNQDATLERFAKQASGTTRLRITRRDISGFEIIVPPVALQKRFAALTKTNYDLSVCLRTEIENLSRTRDLLLPRLLSGEVLVAEAALTA